MAYRGELKTGVEKDRMSLGNPKESKHTFMPSSEKQGGTAELSSSASLSRMGNFSTADIGISPR